MAVEETTKQALPHAVSVIQPHTLCSTECLSRDCVMQDDSTMAVALMIR